MSESVSSVDLMRFAKMQAEIEKLKVENEGLKESFLKLCRIRDENGAEIEKLQAELKQVIEIGVEGQREINRKAHAEITKITRQRDIMKMALEFYADQKKNESWN